MYRGQDAMRLSPLVYHDSEGMRNVFEMSRYCNSITTCRRTLMRSYFGRVEHTLQSAYQRRGANAATASTAVSSRLESINRWTLPAEAIVNGDHADICQGKCDICDGSVFGDTTYDDGTPKRKLTMIDMTFHAFVLCTILDVMSQTYEEKVTQAKLMDIWHGRLSGFKNRNALDELKAQFALAPEVDGSEVDGEAASVPFPLDKKFISEEAEVVCSGVECHYGLRGLSFRDAPHSHNITKPQRLIVQLMLDGLIEQEFHNTAYSTVVYLRAGAKGRQLVRCLQDHRPLPSWWQPRFEMMMDVPKPKKSNASVSSSKRQKVTNVVSASSKVVEDSFEPSVPVKRKRASKKPPVTQTTLDEFKGKKQAAIDALADIKGKSKAVSSAEPHKPDSDFHIDDGVDLDAFDHADTFDLPEDLFDESLFTKESGNITNAVVFTPTEKLSSKKRLSALKSTLGRSIPRAAIIHVESDDNDGDEDLPAVAISSRHPAANTQPRAATVTIDWNSSDDDFDVNDSSVGGKAAPATNDDWTFS